MQIEVSSELAARLEKLAVLRGDSIGDVLQDAVHGYLADLDGIGSLLDSRYDDYKSGKAQTIDGEEAFARLREKSARLRSEKS